ncbi:5'-_3' exoribonuclease [Entamoeba marina]
MGVPSFYMWVRSVCAKYERRLPKKLFKEDLRNRNQCGEEFDNLFIDFNGIVHNCSHSDTMPDPESQQEIIERIFVQLDRYVNYIRPRKMIYIAIDGVCPVAKIVQQRKRRFTSARDSMNSSFDSNCITPGTPFMEILNVALRGYITQRMDNDLYWASLNVIFSDSTCPGEGEHKIFEFIRKQSSNQNFFEQRHCVYGMDSDLIMLSLASSVPNIKIIREEHVFAKSTCSICGKKHSTKNHGKLPQLLLCDPLELRKWLISEARKNTTKPFDELRLVHDFVFITYLVGNDFLPKLPSVKVQSGGMELLLKFYWPLLQEEKYLTNVLEVNNSNIKYMLSLIAEEESALLKNISKAKKIKQFDVGLYYDSSVNIRVGEKGYYERYYNIHFGSENNTDSFKKKMVHDYFEGLVWVFLYYTQGVQSWRWFYGYHYAPFAFDFKEYLSVDDEIDFDEDEPISPLEQLLSVLPPQSFGNIPGELARSVISSNSPILSYYSTNFKTDINGESQTYKGVPEIEFVDQEKLHKCVENELSKVKGRELKRNRKWGEANLFVANSSLKRYKEQMQDIIIQHFEQIQDLHEQYCQDPNMKLDPVSIGFIEFPPKENQISDKSEIPDDFSGIIFPVIDNESVVVPKLCYFHFTNGKVKRYISRRVTNYYYQIEK